MKKTNQRPQYKSEKWNELSIHFGFFNVKSRSYSLNAFNQILKINPKSILDIGCCTADYIMEWRKAGYKGKYFGFDVTPNFINESRKRLPNEKFAISNLYNHESDEKHDLVICQNVLMHLPEIEKAIKKIFSFSNNYVFLSFYGTKGETKNTHTKDFINFHYNINDVLRYVPKDFCLVEDFFFENGYETISIIQMILRKV